MVEVMAAARNVGGFVLRPAGCWRGKAHALFFGAPTERHEASTVCLFCFVFLVNVIIVRETCWGGAQSCLLVCFVSQQTHHTHTWFQPEHTASKQNTQASMCMFLFLCVCVRATETNKQEAFNCRVTVIDCDHSHQTKPNKRQQAMNICNIFHGNSAHTDARARPKKTTKSKQAAQHHSITITVD